MRDAEHEAAVDVAPRIKAELVRYLVRQAPTGFMLGALAILAIVVVLWDAVPLDLLFGWLAASIALSLPAIVTVWRFGRVERSD